MVDHTNNLAVINPVLAKEWDYERNTLIPEKIAARSCQKVHWVCSKNPAHRWQAKVVDRVNDHGCPVCFIRISKPEIAWLNSLDLPDDPEHRQVRLKIGKKSFQVDGFDPTTNTVYEFWGDYWHGNPDKFDHNATNTRAHQTFGQLYAKTKAKEASLISAGYKVVVMWENEWKRLSGSKPK
jgi:hypothetical protein